MITQAQVVGFWLSRRPQLRSMYLDPLGEIFKSGLFYGHCGHSLPIAFFQREFS